MWHNISTVVAQEASRGIPSLEKLPFRRLGEPIPDFWSTGVTDFSTETEGNAPVAT
jgi:hypothetical protein